MFWHIDCSAIYIFTEINDWTDKFFVIWHILFVFVSYECCFISQYEIKQISYCLKMLFFYWLFLLWLRDNESWRILEFKHYNDFMTSNNSKYLILVQFLLRHDWLLQELYDDSDHFIFERINISTELQKIMLKISWCRDHIEIG